ncbi:MAG: DUF2167 domain-containing protein [Chitinophagaceae bacterium]|nr:DUF2167 domain-containing protein [Chitinophagaceae bacterium]
MKFSLSCLLFVFMAQTIFAQTDSLSPKEQERIMDSINNSFTYLEGEIKLSNNTILLKVPQDYKFLDAKQSRMVLEDLWGNLKDETVLGMLFPKENGPLLEKSWAFVVSYDEMGFVKDDDAKDMNYDDLLKELKEDNQAANVERKKQGLQEIVMVGWAEKPYYDNDKKTLHWAREFSTDVKPNTLNYDLRILGRKGVLSMNAVATMDELEIVKNQIGLIRNSAQFTEGNNYSSFNSSTDKIAAYTIGGLVAGKLLAKVGLFALLLKNIKLIGLGIVGLFAGLRKWWQRRQGSVYKN